MVEVEGIEEDDLLVGESLGKDSRPSWSGRSVEMQWAGKSVVRDSLWLA